MGMLLTGECITAKRGLQRGSDGEQTGEVYYQVSVLDREAGKLWDLFPDSGQLGPFADRVSDLQSKEVSVTVAPYVDGKGRLRLGVRGSVELSAMEPSSGVAPLRKLGS